ncbi:MAG: EamA/RhaT family transporter [Bacteroidetes bacterium]|nr:MAG: EamA/RhaT family transporter [Bacteroidota bacterium]
MNEFVKKDKLIGALAISLAASFWGIDGVILTPRLHNLNVVFVVFILHALAFLIMNTFMFKEYRQLKNLNTSDTMTFFLIALLGGAIGTMSIVHALFLVNFEKLTIVILLQKLQPIFAIALAVIFLGERMRRFYFIWAGLAIIAGYFLTFGAQLPNFETGDNTIEAALFSLLAAFSFGSSTVLSKKILGKYSFHTATFFRYGFTTVIMLLFVVASGLFMQFDSLTTDNWIVFLIIAVTTGSGALFLYYYGLKKVRAVIATICELFFPVTAIILDYLINDQRLSWVQWVSAFVMLFAIINLNITNSRKAERRSVRST